MGHAYVTGLQSGRRRNASSTAIARMASTCKHFAAFGSPQGGLCVSHLTTCERTLKCSFRNIAQVSGGERELRTMFLKPFNRACVESLAIMTAYSSYDGVPAIANSRTLSCSVSLIFTVNLYLDRPADGDCESLHLGHVLTTELFPAARRVGLSVLGDN